MENNSHMSIKISQLPIATSITDIAIFPVVQNATTEQITFGLLADSLGVTGTFQVNGTNIISAVNGINFINGNNIILSNPANGNIIISASGIPNLPLVAKGDLLGYNGSGYINISVGTNGQVLTANSSSLTGLSWANGSVLLLVTKGDLLTFNGTADSNLSVGITGQVLTANSSAATGLSWANIASGGLTVNVVSASSVGPGQFTVAHSLGIVPKAVGITMTSNTGSAGFIWLNTATVSLGYDSVNIYCIASDSNLSAQFNLFH